MSASDLTVTLNLTNQSYRSARMMFSMWITQCFEAFLVSGEHGSLMNTDIGLNAASSLVR
jgi:hypothetical protein